jgi:putative ATP-dependent endonuclease of OLD family
MGQFSAEKPVAPGSVLSGNQQYVRIFACQTTFERAATLPGTLEMFACAADDIGAPKVARKLREGIAALDFDDLDDKERDAILAPLRKAVLSTAKRFGKARFAQIAARHVHKATSVPKYLGDAARWLIES